MFKFVWFHTSDAAEKLNLSAKTLYRMRVRNELKKGTHWKVKNPSASRLTYLYNVPAIEELQKSVVTEVPTEPAAAPVGIQPALVDDVESYGITAAGEAVRMN